MVKEIFEQTAFNRAFELEVENQIKLGNITVPCYLSLGTEHIPASIFNHLGLDWSVFPQHRCHSWYLSHGGDPLLLAKELLSHKDGLRGGYVGSASLCKDNFYGHSGLLGDNLAIAAGFCDATNKKTLAVLGDGAIEEDYALGSLGYIATKKLPLLLIIEDNNLSILTKKDVRRSWDALEVAKSFGLQGREVYDNDIAFHSIDFKKIAGSLPYVLQIKCQRHGFHVGAGRDSLPNWDSYKYIRNILNQNLRMLGSTIENNAKNKVKEVWELALQKQ